MEKDLIEMSSLSAMFSMWKQPGCWISREVKRGTNMTTALGQNKSNPGQLLMLVIRLSITPLRLKQ